MRNWAVALVLAGSMLSGCIWVPGGGGHGGGHYYHHHDWR